mgnify:CR=1 FL=1
MDAQLIEGKALIRVREICLTGNSAVEKKDLYIWGAQSNGFENMYTYMIAGDGQIVLQHTLLPQGKLPLWLPRVGMTLTLDERLNQVEWYGRGLKRIIRIVRRAIKSVFTGLRWMICMNLT